MSREIKFRLFEKETGSLYTVKHLSFLLHGMVAECRECDYSISESDFVLMQYTGLKDKSGKDIYEGDIIEFDKREWGGDDNIHIVSWDEKDGSWCWGGGSSSDMDWREVIGNIYENPELLS